MVWGSGEGVEGLTLRTWACRCPSLTTFLRRMASCLFCSMRAGTSGLSLEGFKSVVSDDLECFTSASSALNGRTCMIPEWALLVTSSRGVRGDGDEKVFEDKGISSCEC